MEQFNKEEYCIHSWITDVQLGDYVECELCGQILTKAERNKILNDFEKQLKIKNYESK